MTCNILRNFLSEEDLPFAITSFCRIMMNSRKISVFDITISFVSAIVNLIIVFFLTYMVFRKAELK